jgi:ABC-type transport system involved in multi-copper enzyme maturation permease subunit
MRARQNTPYRRRRPGSIGLPLLTRDLTKQAGQARHYVFRTAFATVLLTLGFLYLRRLLAEQSALGPLAALGSGPQLFNTVVFLEAFAILVFVPALSCGAIAGEKERNTLSILLTTRLGPATIVVEKLLSRLVLIFSLLLLSLPLFAFAYTMGGLSLEYMLRAVLWLAGISVLVATLALMCSAWCGSPVAAFFMTYAIGIGLFIGVFGFLPRRYWDIYLTWGVLPSARIWLLAVIPPSVVFFVATVLCLVRRASVTPQNFVLRFFRLLDVLFNRLNVLTGNIVLTREKTTLPGDAPIAWRETAKKSLGTVRYLVRIFVAVELPTLFLLLLGAKARRTFWGGGSVGNLLWLVDWSIGAVLIAVMCASIVSRERTRQTLPALLATPMPGERIILELFAGVRRVIFVLWIPFATIAGFDFWFRLFPTIWGSSAWVVCAVLQLTIYPFLIAWVSFYFGAKIRSPIWAVVTSLGVVAGAVLLRFVLLWLVFGSSYRYGRDVQPSWLIVSPVTVILINEFGEARLGLTCVNFLIYGGLLLWVRRYCLRHADLLLGRALRQTPTPVAELARPLRDEPAIAPA